MPTLAQLTAYTADLYQRRPLKMRSPKWAGVRDHFLALHPFCAACGYRKSLNVHHILAYHVYPQLELDPKNLITLGENCPLGNCHLRWGHLGSWKSWNSTVVKDTTHFLMLLRTRPEVPYKL